MIIVHTTFHGIHRPIMTSLHKMFLIAQLHTTFEIVMVIFLLKYLHVLYIQRKRIYSKSPMHMLFQFCDHFTYLWPSSNCEC
jgi:hypothetical protein